jgi:tetratricopeptide (TPR) repeat protein/predicted Ser/Thr protein kinase
LIGNILGNRYRILREIGTGGMAKVYLAEDVKSGDLVAVKVLYSQFTEDISFIQRFNREAKLASTLTDPHIVRVLDYGADRDQHYLVMEYVEGENLHDKLKRNGSFAWKHTLELLDQLATALEHAHTYGVVHRDIKPQNMMLNENGLLKILDFGIARIPTLPSLTQSGFIGSPYYASPEQAMGEEVDIRSDIYSAGIVLYELLSGNIPFDAKSPWSIISQHITSEPPPIRLAEGEIPKAVRDLLNRMLAKRADDRFQTPTALRQGIATILTGNTVPDETQEFVPAPSLDKGPLIASLQQRARDATAANEWAKAVDLLIQAAKLDPANVEIAKELAGVEREARLDSLYKFGKRAMESERWEEAVNHFNVIVELAANYKDIETLLAQAHQALKKENTQSFVATRYREGVAHFEAQRWENAAQALEAVLQADPNYEQVKTLLAETKRHLEAPPLPQRLLQSIPPGLASDWWRWGLVLTGIIVIAVLTFLVFGDNNQTSGDDDVSQRLKSLYEEAQQALERGNRTEAVAKLEQILSEDPDYADVAQIRRELLATPTPTITPPDPVVNVIPTEDLLSPVLDEVEENVNLGLWTEAIEALTQLRSQDADYQSAQTASLFCDAYAGRGLESLDNIGAQDDEKDIVTSALADFQAGLEECPRRTDLKEQVARASAYLEVLNTSTKDYDMLIRNLTPIVAADPDYASERARELLYKAYLERAKVRQQSGETIAAALGDYEAALALNVDDPGEAQTQRAELLLSFSQQPVQTATPEPTSTPIEEEEGETPVPTPTIRPRPPTPTPGTASLEKYRKPSLISPVDDTIFAGEFAEVFLEWEPIGPLAADEYYDLTIMHLFAETPQYTGSRRTRDTRVQIGSEIGVGQAAGDRFYWWVTVRKDKSATSPNSIDLPLSPRSDAGTFIWAR